MFNRLWNRTVAAVCLVALSGVLCGAVALAGKPVPPTPPPPAPGTIYFSGWVATSGNDGYYQPMTMKGDGTDKKSAFSARVPSYKLHGNGNSRWFFQEDYDWDGPVDEWGFPKAWELYAVNEQNQWVQLTGDPNIHLSNTGFAAWAKDDSFVTYPAWWFTGPEEWNVQGGLFVVAIDWSSGAPVAGAPQLLFELDAIWFDRWNGNVNISDYHDWSPDGKAVVFGQYEGTLPEGTYIADFSSVPVQIRALAASWDAVWSPDGSRIAFSNAGIWTINPDNTNAVRLTQQTTSKTQVSPSWSPDGDYIAYIEAVTAKNKTTRSIMRMPSGGGTAVNLTSDLVQAVGPQWRP